MSLNLILGPTVIAAIIAGIVSLYTLRKNNQIQYMMNEEKERCGVLREIISRLEEANYDETLKVLTDLKSRINAFGMTETTTDYLKDTHIWGVINKIENLGAERNENILKKQKRLLTNYLLLLIQYIGDESKQKIRGNIEEIVSYVFWVSSCVILGVSYLYIINEYEIRVSKAVPIIILLIILILFITWTITSSIPTFYYKIKNGERKISMKNFIVTWVVLFIAYMVIYFEINLEFESIELIIVFFVYFIGAMCFFLAETIKISRVYEYQKAIESLEQIYENQ